ncbi:MAG: CRTAC1 family protein [Pseudomonadota bacterium]
MPNQQKPKGDDSIIGKAFRRSVITMIVIIALGVLLYRGDDGEQIVEERAVEGPKVVEYPLQVQPPVVRFTDITEKAGIDFVHVNGAYGDKLLPETMGGGVAFLDYDKDGDQDLLLVNSRYWSGHVPPGAATPTMALYRNDGTGHFEDVTVGSGLDRGFYGMGVAVGDYDNDSQVDVFITAVGENHLFRNNSGVFEEVTASAGVGGRASDWSTSAAFIDVDNDADLDLFVGNYVQWSKEVDFQIDFRLTGIGRAYGPPTTFAGSYPYLYLNDGEGRFSDVSAAAGIQVNNPATGEPMAKSLGVMPVDIDGDGWMDLFVANDTVQNFFFYNQGDGHFQEQGVVFGLAFDRNGSATGAMGADASFYRNDADLGLAVGNFANEMTSLYVSQGDPTLYADEAIGDGIGPASRRALTFGLFFFDYDLDGRLDLMQANGHLEEEINLVQPSQHYAQPAQLFWNCGADCPAQFVEVAAGQSGDLNTSLVGRGASFADIDGDGDLDVVITQVGRRPLLLRNDQSLGHHWLRVKPVGRTVNRDGIGTWIEVVTEDRTQRRQVMPTRGYLSQVQLPVTFGLGKAQGIEVVRMRWPDGSVQELKDVAVDSVLVVEQD